MLRRAVEVFGFHLASVDLRQNSDVHERVIAELFETARPGPPFARRNRPATRCCWRSSRRARPLLSPFVTYSEETAGELDIIRTAADIHRRLGSEAVPNYVISKATAVSDVLEVALLLKEVGLLRPLEGSSTSISFRSSKRSTICATAARSWIRCCRCPITRACSRAAGASGSYARLLRQQQGRRLPDLRLGALQGGNRADRRVRAARLRCGCFTDAADRSDAAAGRATRPSSRSRPALSRPASASPSRARSLPASISTRNSAGRISTTWLRQCWRCAPARCGSGAERRIH